MSNRLAGETSPYLLQHATNPVDWFPWGPDALARAKLLDRPIFLSIGYAACHWCHVMERESFEDEPTARILNDRFVAIKVDREERPDLDSIYMGAVQAMTGAGGWPMSVFLTPDGAPFYGGTYYPDRPRHGMPSFSQVLDGVWQAWTTQRGEVVAAGQRLVATLAEQAAASAVDDGPVLDGGFFAAVDDDLLTRFDTINGSWGGAPKFPQPMTIEYLLRRMAAGAATPAAVVAFTLEKMADGGIHDQLGGGFHRYATDARWLVPHFEQMLYDNAQLARVYLHAWAVFEDHRRERFGAVAREVLDYLLRELQTDDRAFAASQDADTEGTEGLTFTWHAAEVRELLGDDAPAFTAAYGVTEDGNWEGVSILSRVWSDPTTPSSRADPGLEARLADARARLLDRRATRAQPARDDKALAAWNGLAIAALAEAGRLLGEERYTAAAVRAAETITRGLLAADGSLQRSWKDGRAVGQGVLEDYAHLAEGLLALYETTFDERWFVVARGLGDRILERFADPAGGFFDTADDHEQLITRPKDPQDNAVPSGGAMATTILLRLAAWTGEGRYRDAAERALGTVTPYLLRYPTGFAQWLVAATFAAGDVVEVAVVGDPADAAMTTMLAPVWSTWRPNQVLAAAPADAVGVSAIPLLAGRVAIDGRPTAYVCRDFVCALPVTDPAALEARL
ncbi:MAG: thioredoxin domain-containing protein [Candidatus Limnocylindrales bacterium]